MDLARRTGSIPGLPAEPVVEHPLRLAVRAVDPRHSRRGSRCRVGTISVLLPANAGSGSDQRADLDRGRVGPAVVETAAALSRVGLELHRHLRGDLPAARQELLSCAVVSDAVRGRSSGAGSVAGAIVRYGMAQADAR